VSLFRHGGRRTQRLLDYLKRRERAPASKRPQLDCKTYPSLFRRRAIVFTDTADFTIRTAKDGILHCLMLFERAAAVASRAVAGDGGEIVKMEADSLLIRFDDVNAACRGVAALEQAIRRLSQGRPHNERLAFSYGIGYGDVLDLEYDLFGLEVNLASKLGEDLARPGEALLTPAAAAALEPRLLKRVVPYKIVTFEKTAIPIQRLMLKRRG
jgi:class 3 adenylate cyclase